MYVPARCISCLFDEGNTVPCGEVLSVNEPWQVVQLPLPVTGSLHRGYACPVPDKPSRNSNENKTITALKFAVFTLSPYPYRSLLHQLKNILLSSKLKISHGICSLRITRIDRAVSVVLLS